MTIQTDPQYKLRMPPELRDKLKEAAKDNHRAMNAEIVARLQDSFQPYAADSEDDNLSDEERLKLCRSQVEASASAYHRALMRLAETQHEYQTKIQAERERNEEGLPPTHGSSMSE